MKRERGSVKKHYPQIKAMHEQGISSQEIGDALGLGRQIINNAISAMGLQKKRIRKDNTKLTYAVKRKPVLEKVIINGKCYTDITEILAPR